MKAAILHRRAVADRRRLQCGAGARADDGLHAALTEVFGTVECSECVGGVAGVADRDATHERDARATHDFARQRNQRDGRSLRLEVHGGNGRAENLERKAHPSFCRATLAVVNIGGRDVTQIAWTMTLDIPDRPFGAYLFDLDGTLVNSMPVHLKAWAEAMARAGLTVPFAADYFYSLGGVPTFESAVIYGEHYGLTFDPHRVVEEKELLYLDMLGEVQLIEPVAAFARTVAASHPVAIVTGGGPEIAYPTLDATGLRSLFSVVITPQDVPPGRGKPHPDMFLLAAERLGVPPAECLVFEDAQPGVVAAQTAGMQVVLVPRQ